MSKDSKSTSKVDDAAARALEKADAAATRAQEKADAAEARAKGQADAAEARAEEKADAAEARARERAERAEARAREQAERAEERAARARDKAAEAEARAAERTERAREQAVRAGRDRSGASEGDDPGTIWLRPEPSSRRPSHTRAEIAAAALEIADADGFEAVSMRRVAQRLGAGTMTLYHYVRNKDELVTLMFDGVMGEVLIPEEELTGGWRHAVERIAMKSREAFGRHGWALERLGDGRPGPNGMRHFEQSLAAIADLGLPPYEKFELIGQIDDYVFGYSLREAEEMIEHERGWPEETLAFFQQQLDSGDYPLIRSFLGTEVDEGIRRVMDYISREGRFERGLKVLLDGIEANVEPKKAKKGTKKGGK